MIQWIIISCFAVMAITLFITWVQILLNKREVFGRPPVNPVLFFIGKICMVSSWLMVLLAGLGIQFELIPVPAAFRWIGAALFITGAVVTEISLITLSISTSFGLSDTLDSLNTGGIYRFSRNPMYLGFILLCLSSCAFTLHPLAFLFTLVMVFVHHRIIVAEEMFLRIKFMKKWDAYSSKVRRYL